MIYRWFTALGVIVITLGVCRVAHANVLSPYVLFWPGIISTTIIYAFPASLLAAFIERPFITSSGIKRSALTLSLRANFFSTIVGILLIPVGYTALYTIGPLWCLVAFGISCVIESYYLRLFVPDLKRRWIVGGNAISNAVLMIIPPVTLIIKQNHSDLARSLEPHESWLMWSTLSISVAIFLSSLVWPIDCVTIDSDIPDMATIDMETGMAK